MIFSENRLPLFRIMLQAPFTSTCTSTSPRVAYEYGQI